MNPDGFTQDHTGSDYPIVAVVPGTGWYACWTQPGVNGAEIRWADPVEYFTVHSDGVRIAWTCDYDGVPQSAEGFETRTSTLQAIVRGESDAEVAVVTTINVFNIDQNTPCTWRKPPVLLA